MIQSSKRKIREPRITLVGAGPGDPELITMKGANALKDADVILYDALVNDQILDYASADAIKVFVGKRSGAHSSSQDEINKLMVDYALHYGHVVRLKGGDPFVFGRGYEEINFAAGYSIPAQVIPGLSSSISVPGLQQIPVTHRGLSESFWVVTGTTASGAVSNDLYEAVRTKATVVVLMGLNKLKEIVKLYQAEHKNNLPVAVIQSGSTDHEQLAIGIVDTIVELVEEKKITAPAIMVFGEVVSLHPDFQPIRDFFATLKEEL
ncbi:uroporphyrinogen-III C-methyltransferase [Pedobacter sp. MC2016-15]|uniref:uroporphyrinogen-III C-methyltransferase n=1 Tax=Pedobacter sp. MC2016-15 TaxID=2994473 RepID=UPI002246B6E3|nr:uroporphyrinogen-III C-methyltransferase [Pedobacter sp. MC2016-15]MCX2481419.1 uroporphyrinogen-III C-methyltransferase [Pedobacter sp. MC2016-15]